MMTCRHLVIEKRLNAQGTQPFNGTWEYTSDVINVIENDSDPDIHVCPALQGRKFAAHICVLQ